jgi:hypothetical protein
MTDGNVAGMTDTGDIYFGEPWGVFALKKPDDARRVEAPIGDSCITCAEPIAEGDRGFVRTLRKPSSAIGGMDGRAAAGFLTVYEIVAVHAECEALTVVGHQFGVCACTGYDPTSRDSARLLWERLRGLAYGHAR